MTSVWYIWMSRERERGIICECQKQAGVHNRLEYRLACLSICQLIAAETKSPVFKEKGIWQGGKPASSHHRWRPTERAERNVNGEGNRSVSYSYWRQFRWVKPDKDTLLLKGFKTCNCYLWETSSKELVHSLCKFTHLCSSLSDPQGNMGTFWCHWKLCSMSTHLFQQHVYGSQCFEMLGAVYTAQVFSSNETLLSWFVLSFTWQRRAGAPETTNLWNQVSEWNLLKPQPSFRLCELAIGVPVNAVATPMLMLAQVNVFSDSHYQTLIKHSTVHPKQVEYDDNLLRRIWVCVA